MEKNTQLHASMMFLLLIIRQIKNTSGLGWHPKGRDSYLTHQNLHCSCPEHSHNLSRVHSFYAYCTNNKQISHLRMSALWVWLPTHSWTCVQQWQSGKQVHHNILLWPYKMIHGNTRSIRGITLTEKLRQLWRHMLVMSCYMSFFTTGKNMFQCAIIMLMSKWFLLIYCTNMGLSCWSATARTFLCH
jgi:hypothetical protein